MSADVHGLLVGCLAGVLVGLLLVIVAMRA
jgi:hypothetical protein